jgi:hypothetical protein
MSDTQTLAGQARQRLALALGSLQAEGVPSELLEVAEPVAKAMGVLHQIESSQGATVAQQAPLALDFVRAALGGLQAKVASHPAVEQAIEAVAGSLNLVHSLSQVQAAPAVTQQAAQPQVQVAVTQQASPTRATAAQAVRAPEAAPVQPAQAPQATQATKLAPGPATPIQRNPGDLQIDAALGAHSTTNFYKGLSGNDVVDSGGIFVATYQIPEIGSSLVLRVSLPGGYEFEARGVVAWTREAPLSMSAGQEAPPGFGARFTEVTPEGRQLVYRYVRNREPLFHDDL